MSLSYNGGEFCGWQFQLNAPSVQETLERALSIAFGETVPVVGAGRTDAGVNARNYIAHFDLPESLSFDARRIICKINAILPPAIVVHNLFRVPETAHARFDAVSRTYRYYVHTSKDPFAANSLFLRYALDFEAMNRAAGHFLGEHDFSSFEKVGADNRTSICTVTGAGWEAIDETHFVFTVTANRFLRNMVRAMVGTLLEIGGGRRPVEWVDEVLEAHDRGKAGQSVPGEALFLEEIRYPYELETI